MRTFLEKAFLLNEEYQRPNPRTIRMSRHLYDLERMMDTPFASQALADTVLYRTIVEHRRRFYCIKGIDYDTDLPDRITFCPTGQLLDRMAEDYRNMTSSFIYGTPPDFATTSVSARRMQRTRKSLPPPRKPVATTSSCACRRATTRWWRRWLYLVRR